MKQFKYLVVGTGVGKAIAYYLANCPDTEEVTLVDINHTQAVAAVTSLPRTVSLIKPAELNVSEPFDRYIYPFFKGYDVIISAVPAKYNFELAKLAINAGVNFCDLGGVVEVTNQILELGDSALRKNVSIIPDCGLMPGLGMVMAKLLLPGFNRVQDLTIYAGGLPQNPKPPLNYQKVFSVEGLEHVCYDNPVIVENNEVKSVEPFSGFERLKVRELAKFGFGGVVECFSTAGASVSPWNFQKLGVENFSEQTVRWPGFVAFVKQIPRNEFRNKMDTLLEPTTKNNPDLVWMEVCVSGVSRTNKQTEKCFSLLDIFDEETNLSAMERTTGFTTAVIARMAAQKKARPGVNTPDNALDYEQQFNLCDELAQNFKISAR